MRKSSMTGSALAIGFLLLASPASAQQYGKSTELDQFRRYGSSTGASAKSGTQGRPYQRQPVPARRTAAPPSRPAVREVHDYFPGMRPGQGPNRNVPVPRCVPGRHSLMSR